MSEPDQPSKQKVRGRDNINVAGRDIVIQRPEVPALGELLWVTKHYLFGMTSGWLVVVAFVIWAAASLLALREAGTNWAHLTNPEFQTSGLLFFCVMVAVAITTWLLVIVRQAHGKGWGAPLTLWYLAKDPHCFVFLGKLGGSGTLCPSCGGKLRFRLEREGNKGPILGCTRNSAHDRHDFDFTAVADPRPL